MNYKVIAKKAAALKGRLTEIRRELHQYPELAFQEKITGRKIVGILRQAGVEVKYPVSKSGVVGLLKGSRTGKTIALRADMDALPVLETNDVPYRSKHEGKMHACGHDAHMTIVLGAAILLADLRKELRGQVKFIFQPAEENVSGAKKMVLDSVLKNPTVDAILGIHLRPDLKFGVIGYRVGLLMAAADHFEITVVGKGGHGANPHQTRDPLVAANQIYQSFQTISRNVNALCPHVLSVCSIQGGTSFNVIPGEVKMAGTLRTYHRESHAVIKKRMQEILFGVGKTYDVQCKLRIISATPAVVNDEAVTMFVKSAADKLGLPAQEIEPTMVSEDFSYFQECVPGTFIRLGTQKDKTPKALHNSNFDFDESVLPSGVAVMAATAMDYLNG